MTTMIIFFHGANIGNFVSFVLNIYWIKFTSSLNVFYFTVFADCDVVKYKHVSLTDWSVPLCFVVVLHRC